MSLPLHSSCRVLPYSLLAYLINPKNYPQKIKFIYRLVKLVKNHNHNAPML